MKKTKNEIKDIQHSTKIRSLVNNTYLHKAARDGMCISKLHCAGISRNAQRRNNDAGLFLDNIRRSADRQLF